MKILYSGKSSGLYTIINRTQKTPVTTLLHLPNDIVAMNGFQDFIADVKKKGLELPSMFVLERVGVVDDIDTSITPERETICFGSDVDDIKAQYLEELQNTIDKEFE